MVERSGRLEQEVTTNSTMSRALTELANHLVDLGIERVVMEATSEYWKPVFYLLEAHGRPVAGEGPQRQAPTGSAEDRCPRCGLAVQGRRTADAAAALRAPRPILQLRDVTRYRSTLVATRTAEKNRVEKLLGDACIKLSVVASDNFGVSGREMMDAVIAGPSAGHRLSCGCDQRQA